MEPRVDGGPTVILKVCENHPYEIAYTFYETHSRLINDFVIQKEPTSKTHFILKFFVIKFQFSLAFPSNRWFQIRSILI